MEELKIVRDFEIKTRVKKETVITSNINRDHIVEQNKQDDRFSHRPTTTTWL